MSFDAWLVLAILIAAVIFFITEWLRVDVVALAVVVALMLSQILTPAEALAGFSNTAVLTIAALFIVGGAVLQTGLAGMLGRRILAIAGTSELRLMIVLMAAVTVLSSFMSNTGTVAVMLPAVIILARSAKISPSKLLIPLSFGSLLGGALTLIGTPPNIIVSDLLLAEGLEPFGFFSFTPMGAILSLAGIGFMILVGRHLLPDRQRVVESQVIETPEELVNLYRLPDNLFRLRVRLGSPLVGQALETAQLGRDYQITVLEILRLAEPRPALRLVPSNQWKTGMTPPRTHLPATADSVIELDDILLVKGTATAVSQTAATWRLGVQPAETADESALINDEVGVAEVILPPRSSLIGNSLAELRFGTIYGLTVLGINRVSDAERSDLKDKALRFGDILLVLGPWKNILALKQRQRDFIVIGQPEQLLGVTKRQKAAVALLVLLGMLGLMISGILPVATVTMLAALAMILTGCLTMDEAYQAIDWKSIVLIAGMLPMSLALEKVAVVDMISQGLVNSLGSLGPLAVMAGLFLLTSAFTQVLSNTATTVIIAPIALASARSLSIEPYAFMMAIAIAASMAFATPVASPVNTLVMGAGDYRFGDYIKVGVPMILLTLLVTVLILPVLWPF